MIVLSGGNFDIICIMQSVYDVVIVAPTEVIIFRGFILENFHKSYTENVSILMISSSFVFIHIIMEI